MSHRSSIRRRLDRLEAARQANAADRAAFFVLAGDGGREHHLEITSCDGGRVWFQERPGPGPQLADFGHFAQVVDFTDDEANF